VSAGCPTLVTITPSSGTLEAGDELTCTANGYNPTYTWTGIAGVNGAIVSEMGDVYALPEGPFNVTCTAKVSQLPAPCHMSATFSDNVYSMYEQQCDALATTLMKNNHSFCINRTDDTDDCNASMVYMQLIGEI